PVDRDVPAGARDLLGAERVPDDAAAIGNDFRELLRAGLPTNHGKRESGELFEADDVVHVRARVVVKTWRSLPPSPNPRSRRGRVRQQRIRSTTQWQCS